MAAVHVRGRRQPDDIAPRVSRNGQPGSWRRRGRGIIPRQNVQLRGLKKLPRRAGRGPARPHTRNARRAPKWRTWRGLAKRIETTRWSRRGARPTAPKYSGRRRPMSVVPSARPGARWRASSCRLASPEQWRHISPKYPAVPPAANRPCWLCTPSRSKTRATTIRLPEVGKNALCCFIDVLPIGRQQPGACRLDAIKPASRRREACRSNVP